MYNIKQEKNFLILQTILYFFYELNDINSTYSFQEELNIKQVIHLFDNLVIHILNDICYFLLNYDNSLIYHISYRKKSLSSRELELMKNNLAWDYFLNLYIEET
jgi:hypothetical protein